MGTGTHVPHVYISVTGVNMYRCAVDTCLPFRATDDSLFYLDLLVLITVYLYSTPWIGPAPSNEKFRLFKLSLSDDNRFGLGLGVANQWCLQRERCWFYWIPINWENQRRHSNLHPISISVKNVGHFGGSLYFKKGYIATFIFDTNSNRIRNRKM